MQRWALGLSYHGSQFSGWQIQAAPVRTVQQELELALQKFLQTPHATICAGRTDAGVHALSQVVHLDTAVKRDPSSWVRGLNAHLAKDVSVHWAKAMPESFDARFAATHRTYHYVLTTGPVRPPLLRQHCGWVFRPLNLDAMREALPSLLGTHDFSAFRASQCQANSPVRTMLQAQLHAQGNFVVLTFQANAFLHHMVRNMVGALVDIGVGRQSPAWLAFLLAQKNRHLSSPTFAPNGLYLARVAYPEQFGLETAEFGPVSFPFPILSVQ
jgi:tRNA pseudouridine38-40 synthase